MSEQRSSGGGLTHQHKQDTDPDGAWQEVFNSHTDSKVRPCSLSLGEPHALVLAPRSSRLCFRCAELTPRPSHSDPVRSCRPLQPQPKGPQSISLDLKFHNTQFTYGIPEHAASFALQTTSDRGPEGDFIGEPFRLYNLDVYEYLPDSVFGLYGSIPFLLGHSSGEGGRPPRTVGAFWLNAAEMFVDVTNQGSSVDAHWFAESGIVDLFLMPGPAAQDVWGQYAQMTGMPMMPPLFAIAYHQCRWNYKCVRRCPGPLATPHAPKPTALHLSPAL